MCIRSLSSLSLSKRSLSRRCLWNSSRSRSLWSLCLSSRSWMAWRRCSRSRRSLSLIEKRDISFSTETLKSKLHCFFVLGGGLSLPPLFKVSLLFPLLKCELNHTYSSQLWKSTYKSCYSTRLLRSTGLEKIDFSSKNIHKCALCPFYQ